MAYAQGKIQERAGTRREAYILELADLDQLEWKSGLGDEAGLKTSCGSDKPHLSAVRVAKLSGNRQRWNHVAAGASTSDQNS